MVANGVGVIDPDYSGPDDEVMIQVLNFTRGDVHVARGDRLAQGIMLPGAAGDVGGGLRASAPPRGADSEPQEFRRFARSPVFSLQSSVVSRPARTGARSPEPGARSP